MEDDDSIDEWLKQKSDKYTMQSSNSNEMLKIMASEVLCKISDSLHHSLILTLIMDEMTDISHCEQAAVVLRHVTDELEVFEEFIGLYPLQDHCHGFVTCN